MMICASRLKSCKSCSPADIPVDVSEFFINRQSSVARHRLSVADDASDSDNRCDDDDDDDDDDDVSLLRLGTETRTERHLNTHCHTHTGNSSCLLTMNE